MLPKKKSKHVALAFPLAVPYLALFMRGVTDYAREHGRWTFSASPAFEGPFPETLAMPIRSLRDWPGDGVIGAITTKEETEEAGDKCSIIFSTEHKAGTLFNVLEVFAGAGINLTRIESMPHDPEGYVFFMDFLGSKNDEKVSAALEEVERLSTLYKFMGCYKEKRID